ncbi:MAG: phosphoadenosine phosphosulfate reductase family protein, partial [Phocaeicola sp.]
MNVYEAAKERYRLIFSEFDKVCISFSNGKDSGVLLNLAIEVAREMDKLPVNVLYIDMESQYQRAIEFTELMFSKEEVQGWWVCLPIHLRNAVSQFQPHWVCWDKEAKDAWVRELPTHKYVVSDEGYFPFFKHGMEFEEFVPAFAKWFSKGKKTACCVGIRTDESLNRWRTIASTTKITYKDKQWTTKLFRNEEESHIYNAYPIYDWNTEDIWKANGKFRWDYNKIYD